MKKESSDHSKIVLAVVLIVVGIIWLLNRLGIHIHFPYIHIENLFYPIKYIFQHWGHFIFSWPMILIIIGLILLAGKRNTGLVLIIVGGIFLIPKIFYIPWLTGSLLFPIVLIGIGVALVVRMF